MSRNGTAIRPRTSSAARPLPPNPTTTTGTSIRRPSVDRSRLNIQEQRSTNETPNRPPPIVSPIESRLMQRGVTGLQNLGNTCFMNSVLQCLSNTKPLLLLCHDENLSSLLNRSNTSAMRGNLMNEYASLIRNMWSGERTVVSPSAFKATVGRFAQRFLGYAQQDSQEFLRYLLQGLHEDMNRVQQKPSPIKINEAEEERLSELDRAKRSWARCLRYEDSPISEIFAGQLKSCLECSECHHKSITFDMFWDLSLPLPSRNDSSTNLEECIKLFMNEEVLDGKEKPLCERCKVKRRCTKKFSFQRCPQILVLHLKRFSQTRTRAKLNTFVDFQLNQLCLSDLPDVMSESSVDSDPTYRLIGVSYHSGTTYSGHYVAACRHPFNQQWHDFNDSSVYRIQDPSRIVSPDAYVLFYERNK